MRQGKLGVYPSSASVPTPDVSSFDTIFRLAGSNVAYGKKSTGEVYPFGDGGIMEINAVNTVFVDRTFGNDATALRQRQDLPCQTVARAQQIANNGDTIYMRAGTYPAITNFFNKFGIIFYCEPGVIINDFTAIDYDSNGSDNDFVMRGYAQINGIIMINQSQSVNFLTADIECDSVKLNSGFFSFALEARNNAILRVKARKFIDASLDLCSVSLCRHGGQVYASAPKMMYSRIGSAMIQPEQATSELVFEELIARDHSQDPTQFAGAFLLSGTTNPNSLTILSGRLVDEKTVDQPSSISAGMLYWNSQGKVILNLVNGSFCRLERLGFQVDANAIATVNGDIENIQGFGFLIGDGRLRLNNSKVYTSNPVGLNHSIVKTGGVVILNDATLVAESVTAESVNAVAPQDIKVYSAVANRIVSAGLVTNIIAGTNLIIDTDVE